MAFKKTDISEFISLAANSPVIDVRSPGEFKHAHFPGAFSMPLFTDDERKIIGTSYKQESREVAIKKGLDFFGPKMRSMVERAESIIDDLKPDKKTILITCWRGGMRSAAVGWLLDMYGFDVYQLTGGYKAYRRWVLNSFEQKFAFKILGGFTGSGKTKVLQELKRLGQNVIDLEALANHKGSAFGALGQEAQPGQEMFENKLALELWKAGDVEAIWLEDESQRIGQNMIPANLWEQMRSSPVYFLDIDFEERLKYLVEEYGQFPQEQLVNAILRISKRLGGLETKNTINYLLEKDIKSCFSILLNYYDKLYTKGLHNRQELSDLLLKIHSDKVNPNSCAHSVLDKLKQPTYGSNH